jgi:hypothetical protein
MSVDNISTSYDSAACYYGTLTGVLLTGLLVSIKDGAGKHIINY